MARNSNEQAAPRASRQAHRPSSSPRSPRSHAHSRGTPQQGPLGVPPIFSSKSVNGLEDDSAAADSPQDAPSREELVGKVNFLEAQLAKTQPSPRHPVAASELQGKIHLLTASLERETQGRKREQEARQVCCPAVHAAWRSCCASRVYGAQTDKQRHDR
jgi:hypothetical protein